MSSFVSSLLFCIHFPLLPSLCLPVVKQEGLLWSATGGNGAASRGRCGARCAALSPCFAPGLQPLLEEGKMSPILAGLESGHWAGVPISQS